jgi:mycofactocin precursor
MVIPTLYYGTECHYPSFMPPQLTALMSNDAPAPDAPASVDEEEALVEADLLVEDVSIDGMCGVY